MNNCNSVATLVKAIGDFSEWEEEVIRVTAKVAASLAKELLEAIDCHLDKTRQPDLRFVGYRSRTIVARFGSFRIKRRLYRGRDGRYHFLLDEAIGLEKMRSFSPSVKTLATHLATHVPFRVAADFLSQVLPESISHQSIHRMVTLLGKERSREELSLDRIPLLEEDEIRRKTEKLLIEADSVSIALQREKKRRGQVKVGVGYSGKEALSLKDKVIHLGVEGGYSFWQAFSLKLASAFDLEKIKNFVVGGDGASWVRIGQRLFHGATFVLDRFHLRRSILLAAGRTSEATEVYEAATQGRLDKAIMILDNLKRNQPLKGIKQIEMTKGYLKANADGLISQDSLGAIESNVDKLVANRMKKRGMSWTLSGAHNLAKLTELRVSGKLDSWLAHRRPEVNLPAVVSATSYAEERLGTDPESWLKAHIPALQGPHSSRPWVKVLKELSRVKIIS